MYYSIGNIMKWTDQYDLVNDLSVIECVRKRDTYACLPTTTTKKTRLEFYLFNFEQKSSLKNFKVPTWLSASVVFFSFQLIFRPLSSPFSR